MEAAVAIYSARYRRHWGAELALQGARLRFSRAYLAFQAPSCQAGMTFGTSSIGFDPADSPQYAVEAAPILVEARRVARIGTNLFAVAALCLFLPCFLVHSFKSHFTFTLSLGLFLLKVLLERATTQERTKRP